MEHACRCCSGPTGGQPVQIGRSAIRGVRAHDIDADGVPLPRLLSALAGAVGGPA